MNDKKMKVLLGREKKKKKKKVLLGAVMYKNPCIAQYSVTDSLRNGGERNREKLEVLRTVARFTDTLRTGLNSFLGKHKKADWYS